jgi:hypothetical protein
MIKPPQKWRAALTVLACSLLGLMSVLAQQISPEYLQSLATVYSGGTVGGFIKDWCDERAPQLQVRNTKALEEWRQKMELPAIDARMIELIGDGKAKFDAELEEKRTALYAQLDGSSQDAAKDCLELEQSLNEDFNLKVLYAEDYKVIAANTKKSSSQGSSGQGNASSAGLGAGLLPPSSSGNGSSTTGSGNSGKPSSGAGATKGTDNAGSSATLTTASSLPKMPAFDYLKFAKTKLNPETEPIPDEYVCWGNFVGEAYKTPHILVQILPGRKYRAAYGSSTTEGAFTVNDNKLTFKTGSFADRQANQDSFEFRRDEGTSLTLYDPLNEPGTNGKRYYACSQRNLLPWKLLEFQRKDPQPGIYPCIKEDGKATSLGTLEILPKRRYRYGGTEGAYSVDITGNEASATVRFNGRLEGINVWYAADTLGRQTFRVDQDTPSRCARSIKTQPVPKFGDAKAPAAPGKGGLEGRYYNSSVNPITSGGGMTYWFYFFQKDGYVYTDDATETDGLMDIDCTKTYPSGIPLCETYSLNGDGLCVGNDAPVKIKRLKNGFEINESEYETLEGADGIKLNAVYETTSGQSNWNTYYYQVWNSEIEFKLGGNFFQADSSKWGNIVSDGNTYRPESGTYRVYGNTLEFKFKDGTILRKFLILSGGRKDLKYISIGGTLYWIKEAKQ